MVNPGMKPLRKVPQRTCIACRQEKGKRELIRLVRSPEQRIAVDSTGKANGRGAYLHPVRACWEQSLKGATIKNALKVSPAPDELQALRAFAQALPAEESDSL